MPAGVAEHPFEEVEGAVGDEMLLAEVGCRGDVDLEDARDAAEVASASMILASELIRSAPVRAAS